MAVGRVHRIVWAIALLLALIPIAPASARALEPVPAPDVTAQAAYVYDATANVELLSLNSDVARAPASTVKIVTAMVVLDNVDATDQQVTVDAEDVTDPTSGESSMFLNAGDVVTVDQLLLGLMLPSGNDAARTLARFVGENLLDGANGDPIERFVQAMNDKVTAAGLSHTHFLSPDGFSDSDDMYTTAYDLAHLGALALSYDKIIEVVSQSTADVTSVGPEAHQMSLINTNKFLPGSGDAAYATDGVIGLKSGSTEKAGACLVLAKRERGGNLVIAVVMGSDLQYDDNSNVTVDDRWDDMKAVLGSVESGFAWLNPESTNDVPGLKDEMAAWQVKLHDDSGLVIPMDEKRNLSYRLELKPAGPDKADAGRVLFFAGSDQIAERELVFQ